jgi:Skp family chaperone for outer membrane proteins
MAMLIVAATAGCRKQPSPTESPAVAADRVAVVDMGQIAKDLGWIDQMNANLTALNNRMRDQVAETGRSYDAVIHKIEQGFPLQPDGKLSPAQQQTIADMSSYAQRIVTQMESAAQSAIDGYHQQCLDQYRDAIMPVVRDVATARKMSVVIDNSNTMLFHDPAVDLTAAVSAAARENIPALTPIPLPNLPQPPALSVPSTAQTAPSTAP